MTKMEPSSVSAVGSGVRVRGRLRADDWFYGAMWAAIAVTVFVGFSRTYYLRPAFRDEPLPVLLHVHGLVFSAWVVLLGVQTGLVAGRRVKQHRKLGAAGAVLAVVMVALGVVTALVRAAGGNDPVGTDPLAFLTIPLGDMIVFAVLIGLGVWMRRRAEWHKRLMLLGTVAILAAAVARLPLSVVQSGPLGFYGVTDAFLLPLIVYDVWRLRRVHWATVVGCVLIVGTQPLRLVIGGTAWWHDAAGWLTGLVG